MILGNILARSIQDYKSLEEVIESVIIPFKFSNVSQYGYDRKSLQTSS